MPEYIERDALMADRVANDPVRIAAKCAPAADVEPVKHGYWRMRGGRIRCSVCDGKALWNYEGGTGGWSHEYIQARSDRCPHCGSKMDMKS